MKAHGVYWRYTDGCRCDACTLAWTAYLKQRKQQRTAYTAEHGLPETVRHGWSAYNNWGCRCPICRAGKSARNRADRARRRAAVS